MDNHYKGRPGRGTLVLISFLIITLVSPLPGCSPNMTSQIRTELQYRERLVPVATSINIPYFVERNVTRDTISHLENPYAKSDARVSDGLLFHTLESLPQTIETTVLVPVTDTLWKESEVHTETVEVEREFTWWEKVRLRSFWWIFAGLIAALGWIFRKPILNLLKLL